jgi:acyl carrier protein
MALPDHLARLGLGRLPVFTSAAVGSAKPDPEPFRSALRVLGVLPERALHIGDDEVDELGARAAGMKFAWAPVREALLAAAAADRRALLESHLREQITHVLKLESVDVDEETPLASLGFDSLMALELRNRLEASLALTLPATLIWSHPTLHGLSENLAQRLEIPLEDDAADEPDLEADLLAAIVEQAGQLSDDELAALDASREQAA